MRAVLDTNVVVSGLFFGGVPRAILDLVSERVFELVISPAITRDSGDDKFMLCARDAGAVVVSGDRHLLEVSGWKGVQVLTPREPARPQPGPRPMSLPD